MITWFMYVSTLNMLNTIVYILMHVFSMGTEKRKRFLQLKADFRKHLHMLMQLSFAQRWSLTAALMLISLPSTYAASKLGPKLMEYIGGDAELAVEHLKVEDIAKTGGEQEIFRVLDERYMPLEKDDMSEALKGYFFETQIRGGESMKNFCTGVATSHRKLQDQGVTLPEEVQGWFLMRKLHLDASQEAMLLTATARSYKVGALVNAVKAILANQRGTHKQKGTGASS